MPSEPSSIGSRLDAALRWTHGRLGARRATRYAAVGAWIGAGLSAGWMAGWLLRLIPLTTPAWLLAPIAGAALIGAVVGRIRRGPKDHELALLVDRLLDADEVATTALEMRAAGLLEQDADDLRARDPRAAEVLHRLDVELSSAGDLAQRLPVRPPRHLRFFPLILLALALSQLLPRVAMVNTNPAEPGDLADEAERLERRRQELEDELDAELPDELAEAFDDLVGDMKAGRVDKGEAADRAKELREQLDKMTQNGGGSGADGASDAADALEGVDQDAAEDLKDALRQGDLDKAADAVEDMRERMEQANPQDRERAARELERAAKAAEQAGNSDLANALKNEADRTRGQQGQQGQGQQGQQQGQQGQQQGQQGQQQGQQGQQQGQQGQQGQQQGQQGQQGQGQSGQGEGDGLAEYMRQLQEQGIDADALANAQRQNELNQRMNGALGGAEGRLGGRQPGQQGQGSDPLSPASWGAGSSHTDQDQGNHQSGGQHQDMDRQLDGRHSSWMVESFQDYDEKRIENVNAVTATVDVPLGEGPVDAESFRLNQSNETAAAPLVAAPPDYRAAAEEAIDGEAIPRAYRDQVKDYFDLGKE